MVGRVIQGRYKLIDERGSGSMASVFIARDLQTNRLYAIKVLSRKATTDAELIQRFRREFELLKQISGAHVIQPIAWGDDQDIYFIVMDYVDGHTLKQIVEQKGALDPRRAINIIIQAADGLYSAASKGIVHRDIKPQNIMLTTDNVVKLTDFGLARSESSAPITVSNVFLGTPYYVSPEQADNGRIADTRSDLYSLACVFFELVSGKVPYDGETAVDVVVQHMRNPPPSVCAVNPSLPLMYDAFFRKGMAKRPQERFQTIQEFVDALSTLLEATPENTLPPPKDTGRQIPRFVSPISGQTFQILKPELIIGRSDPNKGIFPDIDLIALDVHHTVSRRHVHLSIREERYFVEDLGAFNKTYINGVPLMPNQPQELREGDTLRLGNVDLRFEIRAS